MTTCYILFVSLIIVTIIDIIVEKDLRKKMAKYEESMLAYKKDNDCEFDNIREAFSKVKEELITVSNITSQDVDKITNIVNECINKIFALEKKTESLESSKEKKETKKKEPSKKIKKEKKEEPKE